MATRSAGALPMRPLADRSLAHREPHMSAGQGQATVLSVCRRLAEHRRALAGQRMAPAFRGVASLHRARVARWRWDEVPARRPKLPESSRAPLPPSAAALRHVRRFEGLARRPSADSDTRGSRSSTQHAESSRQRALRHAEATTWMDHAVAPPHATGRSTWPSPHSDSARCSWGHRCRRSCNAQHADPAASLRCALEHAC
ncbi:hypothetical protein FA09DRAFT_31725 [Tilletiopsis washingtonensis]|jgi:hypothetical protein|uniref:Uncharacterized protein n=1 Tax=Tilletiopsis washingtonensis TaxID=58919 RepID=A0A316ZAA4_9BASI|nr:hypothetical protein FA09DRAFT_31725 [Tilletiopsis washingtonensis]PWN97892.1 hypothetical protein FA09DRAFT_31725 [Tilletiopsis washingtonensis]